MTRDEAIKHLKTMPKNDELIFNCWQQYEFEGMPDTVWSIITRKFSDDYFEGLEDDVWGEGYDLMRRMAQEAAESK